MVIVVAIWLNAHAASVLRAVVAIVPQVDAVTARRAAAWSNNIWIDG